jgi:ferredoxin
MTGSTGSATATPKRVRLKIDANKCQGHNRCKAIAPELIQLDQFGNAQPMGDGLVPDALLDKAYLAKSNCPELALEIVEE